MGLSLLHRETDRSPRGITAPRLADRDVPWLSARCEEMGAIGATYQRLVLVNDALWWTHGGCIGTGTDDHAARLDRPISDQERPAVEQPDSAALRGMVVSERPQDSGPKATLLVRQATALAGQLQFHFAPDMRRRDVLAALRGHRQLDVDDLLAPPRTIGIGDSPVQVMVDTRTPPSGAGARLPWLDDERARRLWRRLRASDEAIWCLDGVVAKRVETLFTPTGVFILALSLAKQATLSPQALLSPSQAKIAEYYAHGATTAEIGRAMERSPETIRSHLRVVYTRLNVATRLELARALEVFSGT